MAGLQSLFKDTSNPLDRVEQIAHGHEWFFDRSAEDEVNMIVAATWGDMSISIHWREDFESLHLACSYDLKVPANRREEIGRLFGSPGAAARSSAAARCPSRRRAASDSSRYEVSDSTSTDSMLPLAAARLERTRSPSSSALASSATATDRSR